MDRFGLGFRLFLAVLTVSGFYAGPVMAQSDQTGASASSAAAVKWNPPLMGDMIKLEVFQDLKKLPEVHMTQDGGGITNLSDTKGKVVVLNIWATWCPPCVKELPSLNALQLAMGNDDFQVIAMSMDKGTEGQKAAKKFMEDNNLASLRPYTDGYDELTKLEAMRDVAGIPVTLILDKKMRVVARYQGDADWNGRAARAVIEYYLKNSEEYNPYEGL